MPLRQPSQIFSIDPCEYETTKKQYTSHYNKVEYRSYTDGERTRTITDRIQRVLNAAVRVVSGTRKFDRGLTKLLHSELHWLDIPQRVQYKLGVIVHQCLQNNCSSVPGGLLQAHIRRLQPSTPLISQPLPVLIVPRHRRSMFGRRAFSVAGPMEWYSLPDSLRDPARSTDSFRSALKTHLFAALRDD